MMAFAPQEIQAVREASQEHLRPSVALLSRRGRRRRGDGRRVPPSLQNRAIQRRQSDQERRRQETIQEVLSISFLPCHLSLSRQNHF
jgi:hypothetical protein